MEISRRSLLVSGAAALLSGCAIADENSSRSPIVLNDGVGTFDIPGGKGHEQALITVHYFKPKTFSARSPILIVVPGAGRNGDDYRDAWLPFATDKGVLVAAPSYAEKDYDPGAYQMGGVIENLRVGEPQPGSSDTVTYLRDEDLKFDVNPRRDEWLFPDFDRLFDLLKTATGSKQASYDMFGHSAGGQVLHRHVLMHPGSRAARVVAANSGFYTLPDLEDALPVGMAGLGLDERTLRQAFSRPLQVLLGEKDNEREKGGSHLHTPRIDQQGMNRLARGKFFYDFAAARAKALGTPFNWNLQVVPDVGHDYRGMTRAAANLLYGA